LRNGRINGLLASEISRSKKFNGVFYQAVRAAMLWAIGS